MKQRMLSILLALTMFVQFQNPCTAEIKHTPEESKELMFQDMLVLFLLPHINKKIDEIYSSILTYSPDVYPYFVEVTNVQRTNGFRGFHFLLTLEVVPTVGPHIPVGKDSFTFDISLMNQGNVKLVEWKHLKDPQDSDFPPNWMDILKRLYAFIM